MCEESNIGKVLKVLGNIKKSAEYVMWGTTALEVGKTTTGACTESHSWCLILMTFLPMFETFAMINQFPIHAGIVVLLGSYYSFF